MSGAVALSRYMACTTSLYGAASLTNRTPAALTMMPPGRVRSARQKYGSSGSGLGGPPPRVVHQVQGSANAQARLDSVPGIRRGGDRPVNPDGLLLVLIAHGQV